MVVIPLPSRPAWQLVLIYINQWIISQQLHFVIICTGQWIIPEQLQLMVIYMLIYSGAQAQ